MTVNEKLILVVDDEVNICNELSFFLNKSGYETMKAHNGEEALTIFNETNPILVITDYKMPFMNGLELLKQIKQINNAVQVILFSGQADMKIVVKAIKEEAFDFISKPVNMKELLVVIESAIKRTRAEYLDKNLKKFRELSIDNIVSHEIPVSVVYFNIPLDEYTKVFIDNEFNHSLNKNKLHKHILFNLQGVNYINNVGLNGLIDIVDLLMKNDKIVMFTEITQYCLNYLKPIGYLEYLHWEQSYDDALFKITKI